jgi:hypothetical protein
VASCNQPLYKPYTICYSCLPGTTHCQLYDSVTRCCCCCCCRAFCVEKNSAAPDVQFVGGEGLTATLIVPYVEFVLTEVLKNAMQVRTTLLCAVVRGREPSVTPLCLTPCKC